MTTAEGISVQGSAHILIYWCGVESERRLGDLSGLS